MRVILVVVIVVVAAVIVAIVITLGGGGALLSLLTSDYATTFLVSDVINSDKNACDGHPPTSRML